MQLKLVQILHLLLFRCFSFDDGFSCRISSNQTFIHCVKDCPFQLMVKIHRCLSFVELGIVIQKLLIYYACQFTHFEFG